MRIVLCLLGLAALAGCADQPRRLAATPPTVTYAHLPGEERRVGLQAQRFCDQYRLDAVRGPTGWRGNERVVTFECR